MDEPCPICKGTGWIPSSRPFTDKRCRCKLVEATKRHLGLEIASAKTIPETPLFVIKDGVVVDDLTKKNVYIESSWEYLLPHLKRVLSKKGIEFHFRVVNDELVKSVYLKERSAKNRLSAGNTGEVYNSLDDLVGETVDLLIVRFGFINWKKSEAPAGIMQECINIRHFKSLITWIVSEPNSDYAFERSLSYSSSLQAHFDRAFTKITFEEEAEDRAASMDNHESTVVKVPDPMPRPQVTGTETLVGPGDGEERKPKFKNYSKKKSSLPEFEP